jgi:hypothetical protein
MKKLLILITVVASASILKAQDVADSRQLAIKWAPTGLILGSLSLQGEYNFGKNSLTAKIGLPVTVNHTFTYEDKDADFQMRATSFLAGYRM